MSDRDNGEPPPKRGKPRKVEAADIFAVLNRYKDRLCEKDDGQTLTSKVNCVWKEIANDLANVKSPHALYTYVSCNKDAVRQNLWKDYLRNDIVDEMDVSLPDELVDNSTLETSTTDESENFSFTIHVQGTDFDKLVETRWSWNSKRRKRIELKKFKKG